MSTSSNEENVDVYELNALGPYNHGTWSGNGRTLGAEEALEGRAGHIVGMFVSGIKKHYSAEQLAEMTMVDVGCYDGFLSVEIEKQVRLKKITAVEPRRKNIRKGEIARRFCGVKTSIEFAEGDIASLAASGQTFDIVFCSGVFHHLENVDWAVKTLKKICSECIFIESQVYFSPRFSIFKNLYDRFNFRVIEPKDIIYKFVPKSYSISGFKFETNYYDGSASGFSLVTVPSPETIKMTLEANGFNDVEILSMGDEYRSHIRSRLRDFSAACLFAKLNAGAPGVATKISKYIFEYERGMLLEPLSPRLDGIFARYNAKKTSFGDRLLLSLITSKHPLVFKFMMPALLQAFCDTALQREIVSNIKFAAHDKILFEFAKALHRKSAFASALSVLNEIVGKPNTDWRITYRAFALMAIINLQTNDSAGARKHIELCLLANSNFPISHIIESLPELPVPPPNNTQQ